MNSPLPPLFLWKGQSFQFYSQSTFSFALRKFFKALFIEYFIFLVEHSHCLFWNWEDVVYKSAEQSGSKSFIIKSLVSQDNSHSQLKMKF